MPVSATVIMTRIRTLADMDSATTTVSDTQLLDEINSAHEYCFGLVVDSDEGFFESVHTASTVAASRSLSPAVTTTFWKIDLVEMVDGAEDMPVFPITKAEKYNYESRNIRSNAGDQFHFYIEGNALQLVPAPSTSRTDSVEVTFISAPVLINSGTVVIDVPDRWANLIALRSIKSLDLRLRDGRDVDDVIKDVQLQLITSIEGRQRQSSRRIVIQQDTEDYDGVFIG